MVFVCFINIPVKSQELVSTFRFKKPPEKNGHAFEVEISGNRELVLFFNSFTRFKLRFLDTNMQLVREKEISKNESELYHIVVYGILQKGNLLEVFYAPRESIFLKSLTINLEEGTYQLNELKARMSSGERVIKIFTFEEKFYIIKIVEGQDILRITTFEDVSTVQTHDVKLPVEQVFNRFKRDQKFYLPHIDYQTENTLFTNFLPEKLYTFDGQFILSFEFPDQGYAQIISVSTEDWTIEEKRYNYSGFQKGEVEDQVVNSLIYRDYLFLLTANASGLYITCKSRAKDNEVLSYHFENDEALIDKFGPFVAGRIGAKKNNEASEILASLRESLIMTLNPMDEDNYVLMLGAYPHLDSRTANTLLEVGAFAAMALSASTGNTLFIDPASASFSIVEPFSGLSAPLMSYYNLHAGYGKYVYAQASFSAETGTIQPADIPVSAYANMDAYFQFNKLRNKVTTISMFNWNKHTYLAYAHRGKYWIVAF